MDAMAALDEFREILLSNQPLAGLTSLQVGGAAEWLARPRTIDELSRLLARCRAENLPVRTFGGGSNLLVSDEGVKGVVLQLTGEEFRQVTVAPPRVTGGAAATLADLLARASEASLSGLETLAGIPGTVGGALRCNAAGRTGDIGQHVHSVLALDAAGQVSTLMRADIRFGYRRSNLDDVIIMSATFELVEDDPQDIVKRLKKTWIAKKASQPPESQPCGYAFRNPRGLSVIELIDDTGLAGTRVGGAELFDRDPRFIIAHPGTTSRDVLRLIDLVRSKVEQRTGVAMEPEIEMW